ncbi:hypothetical protein [Kitasatospora purpeofusca]|uniref:hypothetical protein n=1 Tax=Kitasatospora purpeofusca TaxID=67352 RepID=UPI0036B1CF1A
MQKHQQHAATARSPAVRTLGHLLATAWFAHLALSGDERPLWLRILYGAAGVMFAAGAAATVTRAVEDHRTKPSP